MKAIDTFESEPSTTSQRIQIPAGLLGLEHIKEFELVVNPAEAPFVWLQSAGVPDVAFLLVPPFVVKPDYQPDIARSDVAALGLESAEDALLFNIVTLRGNAPATVNLKGPIVINRLNNLARQVVLSNAADYSVRQPIVVS